MELGFHSSESMIRLHIMHALKAYVFMRESVFFLKGSKHWLATIMQSVSQFIFTWQRVGIDSSEMVNQQWLILAWLTCTS